MLALVGADPRRIKASGATQSRQRQRTTAPLAPPLAPRSQLLQAIELGLEPL
jgi:hypothetical protein